LVLSQPFSLQLNVADLPNSLYWLRLNY